MNNFEDLCIELDENRKVIGHLNGEKNGILFTFINGRAKTEVKLSLEAVAAVGRIYGEFCRQFIFLENQHKKEVEDFCAKHGLTEDQFYGRAVINQDLSMRGVEVIPDGFNPTVNGSINLPNLIKVPVGFNPIVCGILDLSSITNIPSEFSPVVTDDLYLDNLVELPAGFNVTVGGRLDLNRITEIPYNVNIIAHSLHLKMMPKQKLPENIKVHSFLLFCEGSDKMSISMPFLSWRDGKYILVDGVFSEVISNKGSVWKVKSLFRDTIGYLATDGSNYSHGTTISIARAALKYFFDK